MSTLIHKRILIVDDESDVRDIIKAFLHEMGIETVIEAANGFEALKFIDSDPNGADLVICDWNMPGMSGHSVFRQFRTSHPHLPFIMVTGRNDFESVNQAKETGMHAYVIKPLTFGELERKVVHAFREKISAISALQSQNMLNDAVT